MKTVHVAVGVICNSKKEIFLAKRSASAHQGGLWEFPGGKVEAGEGVEQALSRELEEEIGIQIQSTISLVKIEHDYGDKCVLLDVYIVTQFQGEASGKEGQVTCWASVSALKDFEFPQANSSIIQAIEAHELFL